MTRVPRSQIQWQINPLWSALLPFLLAFGLLVYQRRPDPQGEQVTAGLVQSAYETACTGAANEEFDHRQWEKIEHEYGQVRRWHILSQRRDLFTLEWVFDVSVVRERASTRERIVASAGPSKFYGYTSRIHQIHVESATPLNP